MPEPAVAEIGGDRVSCAELWERAARVAGGLRGEGVQRGDRVALRDEPLPRNPAGKVLKAQLRDETEWGEPLR